MVVALHLEVEVQFGIVRLVQCGHHTHIQGVNSVGGITGNVLHLGVFKDAHVGQTFLNAVLLVQTVALPKVRATRDASAVGHGLLAAETLIVHPAVEHVRAYIELVVVVYRQVAVLGGLVGHFALTAQQPEGAFPFIEDLFGHGWHPLYRHQLHRYMATPHQSRVGLINQVVGAEVVTTYIAQQGADAVALLIQVEHVELLTRADERSFPT